MSTAATSTAAMSAGAPGRPDVEVHAVAGPGSGAWLDTWARNLDASVIVARRRGLVGRVVAIVVDRSRGPGRAGAAPVTAPSPEPGGVEHWTVQASPPPTSEVSADLVLLADVGTDPAPTCLVALLAALDDPTVGVVEPRHIPFQSAKPIDLRTAEVSWASASCCLVRREVLEATGGLDLDSFPDGGADVDLSWKARLAGWSVRAATGATVFDRAPVPSGERLLEASLPSSSARLRLMDRHIGAGAARAWAKAWAVRGTSGEREAAARYEVVSAGHSHTTGSGDPDPGAGADTDADSDAFARELFGLQATIATTPDRYDLTAGDLAAADPSPPGQPPPSGPRGEPFLSVVMRTRGTRPAELEDSLLSLAAQTCTDFEVLLMGHDLDSTKRRAITAIVESFRAGFAGCVRLVEVTGGGRARPLNTAIEAASGHYLAYLDDDDVALCGWVAGFHEVAVRHPGAVVWSRVAWQDHEVVTCAGGALWRRKEAPKLFVREFDLMSHLFQNGTTNCALAVPRELVAGRGLRFREDLAVFEDWAMVLRLAELAPFVPTGTVTALYRRGSADSSGEVHDRSEWDDSASMVLADLDRSGYFIRGEHMPRLRAALEELAAFRRDADSDSDDGDENEDDPTAPGPDRDPTVGDRLMPAGYLDGRRAMVVGPHLDDAVLSCGALLPELTGATVLTVFAGSPPDWSEVTPWDEACGFDSGTDVLAARLREDDRALAHLGATGVRLPFRDEQYRDPGIDPDLEEIGEGILAGVRVAGAEVVFVPLGLGHVDHRLTAAACVWALHQEPHLEWYAYQDLPYAYEAGWVEEALAALAALHPEAVRWPLAGSGARKAAALACYASQVSGLGAERVELALRAERYWRLSSGS